MVFIDHGAFLHHSCILSVVRQGLKQSHAHRLTAAEERGGFRETEHPAPCGFDFTSHKPVSRELTPAGTSARSRLCVKVTATVITVPSNSYH